MSVTVPCREVVLFSEVTNLLSLCMGSESSTCRGCPLLRGDKCTITMGSGDLTTFCPFVRDCPPVAVALKVHVAQSFIKGHRKSGVISIKHSSQSSPHTVE